MGAVNDLVTYGLDVETFAQDVIAQSEGPELVRAFWNAIHKVSFWIRHVAPAHSFSRRSTSGATLRAPWKQCVASLTTWSGRNANTAPRL